MNHRVFHLLAMTRLADTEFEIVLAGALTHSTIASSPESPCHCSLQIHFKSDNKGPNSLDSSMHGALLDEVGQFLVDAKKTFRLDRKFKIKTADVV